jgi:hypothetical protein
MGSTLQDVLNQAVKDAGAFHDAADKVVEDQKVLTTDQEAEQAAATTAQASIQAGIAALTAELAQLPAVPAGGSQQ